VETASLSPLHLYPAGSWEEKGGVVIWFLAVLYLFVGIAIVCDDFFVSSLEAISEALKLSEDVAGATFMAAGSSAPELFSSLMSLVAPSAENELGVGTIVGSAVFNILVIIGATAVFSGQVLLLDWRPVLRDLVFYTGAVVSLIGIFADGKVTWHEGLVILFCYIGYILFMKVNPMYNEWCAKTFPHWIRDEGEGGSGVAAPTETEQHKVQGSSSGDKAQEGQAEGEGKPNMALARWHFVTQTKVMGQGEKPQDPGAEARFYGAISAIMNATGLSRNTTLTKGQVRAIATHLNHEQHHHHHHHDEEQPGGDDNESTDSFDSPFEAPERAIDYPYWILSLPWYAAFTISIPDCRKPKWQKWYLVSFIMSIAWIGLISYWMVDWCARIGCILNIPSLIMGVTVLAAGTSIPDALSSIVVARQGMGDMAVANAIGSNVFDIWMGLGAPWFFVLLIDDREILLADKSTMWYNVFILMFAMFFYLGVIAFDKFRLRATSGYLLMGMYVVYALWQIIGVAVLDAYGTNDKQ